MTDTRISRAHGLDIEDLDVVVVDDSKPMQTIVRSMLNAARVHRVRVFDNAGDAYRAMLVEPPHILVTDWNLPDTDGLSLVRSMREPRSGPLVAVPAILITGHATRDLVEKAIGSGIHFVLAKPLSPSNVIKRIVAATQDDRRFVLDHARRIYVLQGADALLAGQRKRWQDLHQGAPRPSVPAVRVVPRPSTALELPLPSESKGASGAPAAARIAAPTAPAPARIAPPKPVDANARRRALGMAAPVRNGPVETSTGHTPTHAS